MSAFRTILNGEQHSIANLPIHVLDKILMKLPGRDLISLLAVSTTFNETIASSDILMDQIRLKAHSENTRSVVIQHSNRNYQHVSIDDHSGSSDDFIESNKFQWKTIKLQNMILTSELKGFISNFSSTIEALEYSNVSIDNYEEHNCSFPKLKSLTIGCKDSDSSFIYLGLMNGITASVQELKIPQNSLIFLFEEMLLNTPNLKKLHLLSPSIDRLWDVENALLIFKDCLEELTVEMLNNDATEFIWNEMTSLKKVTLRAFNSKFKCVKPLNLNENNNIQELIVHNNKVPFQIYEEIVKTTPKLSILEIHHYKKDQCKQTSGTTYCGKEMRDALWKKYTKVSKADKSN